MGVFLPEYPLYFGGQEGNISLQFGQSTIIPSFINCQKSHTIMQFVNILLPDYPHALYLCRPANNIKQFIFCSNQLCTPSGFIMDVTCGSKLFTEELNLKNPTI